MFVDRIIEERWEDLDLPIPIGPEETELQHVVHTWIAWPKRDIRLVQADTDSARLKASRPLIRVLVINDHGLWINDFI